MSMRGIQKLKNAARRLRNRLRPGGLILLYHRVTELDMDPWSLCVAPHHFSEHLEVLRTIAAPMSLPDLLASLRQNKSSHRPVAVTFDDGYADNLLQAKPLLEHHDVPGIVFVTTGHTGTDREFWWDELERVLLEPAFLPDFLHLSISGRSYRWNLDTASSLAEEESTPLSWKIDRQPYPRARHVLYLELWRLLHPLDAAVRDEALHHLQDWAGTGAEARLSHRAMTPAEIRHLAQGGLVEIGAHTVSHPSLPAHSRDVQRDEIRQSKMHLEEIIGKPIKSFAYPYGDYSPESTALVREAGFAYACSTEARSVRPETDRFVLPRFEVRDWDGDTFARRLSEWFYE